MSLRIVKRNPSGQDKEVILEIDPTQSGSPSEQTFSVKGTITDEKAQAVEGITVRAYDKGLNTDILLGEMPSNVSGEYLIYYNTGQLAEGKLHADLQVKAFDTSGEDDELLAESAVYVSALSSEVVDLNVAVEEFVGPSEYAQMVTKMEPYLQGIDLTLMTLQGVTLLASKINIDPVYATDFLKARLLTNQLSADEEVLYGMMRFDLPYDASELLRVSDEIKTEAILAMTESNIIDPAYADDIEAILASFNQDVVGDALIDESSPDPQNPDPSPLAQLLTQAGLNSTKQNEFYASYLEKGSETDFWDQVVTDTSLTSADRDQVRFVFQLGVVTQQHLPLVTDLVNDANIQGPEDLGSLTTANWLAKINNGVGVPNIDTPTTDEKNAYAAALIGAVEQAFPTRVLKKSIDDDPDYDNTDLKQFVTDNPTYDFKDVSPRKFIQDNPNALDNVSDPAQAKAEIYRTKRLFHVAGGTVKKDTIKALADNNLDSAVKIASKGKRSFIKQQSTALGGDAAAEEVYKKAVKRTAAAVMMHANYNPAINNVGTRVFTGSPVSETDTSSNPELEVFFGSQDYCNCTHCRSSFSPAAYLVDLLAFLKEAENGEGGLTAWEQLDSRRPEIRKIALSCDNTNTPMPYIDLVNEVLEHAVSPGTVDRQTTRESDSLKTQPEYLNIDAYDILATAIYPWSLPFNLWNEEARAYLAKLGIARSKIARATEGKNDDGAAMSINEAAIHLNISTAELAVLKDTSTVDYYDVSQTSELEPVEVLMEQSGLSYAEVLELLDMQFINPTGKEVTFTPPSSCSLSDATLDLDLGEYNKLHRFVRLQKLIQWPAYHLDMAITALGESTINESLLIKITAIEKLRARLRLSVDELLSWYGPLSDRIYSDSTSQYEHIFLNPVYNTDDFTRNAFAQADSSPVELVTTGGTLNNAYGPVVLGALRIKAEDLLTLVNRELPGNIADKNALSYLYAIASFTRALRLSVQEFLDLKALLGNAPLSNSAGQASPQDTLQFLAGYDTISRVGFSIDDFNYLFRHDLKAPYAFSKEESITTLLTVLRSRLQERLAEKGIGVGRTREDLLSLLLVFLDESSAVQAVELVTDGTIDNAAAIVDSWADFIEDVNDAKSKLVTGGGSLTDLQERMNYVFSAFHSSLVDVLLLNEGASQLIAELTDYSTPLISLLLGDELASPADPGTQAIQLFSGYDFIFSTSAIINNASYDYHFTVITLLYKLLFTVEKLEVETDQVSFVLNNTTDTQWFDLKTFPTSFTGSILGDVPAFLKLVTAFELEQAYGSPEFSMTGLVEQAVLGATPNELQEALITGTGWEQQDLNFLTGSNAFNFQTSDYKSAFWLKQLAYVFNLTQRVGASAEQLFSWAGQDITYSQAQAIRISVKSQYDNSSWHKVGAEVRDTLRAKQRDALSAYLIANHEDFYTTDDLYGYYLLDTEMAPCAITSRIKLAISTVQLWVQRIRMDLEVDLTFTDEDLDEWNWRKNYRVWEAARKIFLYPENWIEPELRDDKSPFFESLEGTVITR